MSIRGIRFLVVLLPLAPTPATAQSMRLQIRPRVGDTLRMQLDQRVEVSGATMVQQQQGADTASAGAPMSGATTTTLHLLTRSIVQRSDASWTTVLIVTDSVAVAGDGPLPAWAEQARRTMEGQRMRLRIASDGHAEVVEGSAPGEAGDELRSVLSQMPAMLPRDPVSPGERWVHVMRLPAGAPGGGGSSAPGKGGSGGTIRATFRFDSIGRGGDLAYISMQGVLARETAPAESSAPGYEMSGTVVGSMVVDRRRGWMTSSRTTLQVQTLITPPKGARAKPMKVRMKVTQWLRAL